MVRAASNFSWSVRRIGLGPAVTGGPSRWRAVLDRADTAPAHNDLPPSGRERFPFGPWRSLPVALAGFCRHAFPLCRHSGLTRHPAKSPPRSVTHSGDFTFACGTAAGLCWRGGHHAKQNGWPADNRGHEVCCLSEAPVPPHARVGTKYCSSACRGMAYRGTPQNGGGRSIRSRRSNRKPSVPNERNPSRKSRRRNERRTAPNTAKSDEQTNANTVPRPARIAFVDQLRKQHPEGAAGYRLVLPAKAQRTRQRSFLCRTRKAESAIGGLRRLKSLTISGLQEGLSYRVLWVDAAGQPLAPTTPYVPRLYFFPAGF